jgi:tryptophan-rich sensory protein
MLPYVISISLISISAIVSSIYTDTESEWYKCADPNSSVPNYAFPYIWFFMYLLLAYITVKIFKFNNKTSMVYIVMILALCSLWSVVYFHYHRADISMGIITSIFIFSLSLLYTISVDKTNFVEPFLMIPFILWITYALILNFISANKDCNNLI